MRKLNIILKILTSFGLVSWFIYSSELDGIESALLSVSQSPLLIVGLIVIFFAALLVNTIKWFLLLRSYTIGTLFTFTLIGIYYSLVLPGQIAGEAVKAYKLGKGRKDAEQIAASVIIDRLTGFIGLLIVGVFGLLLSQCEKAATFKLVFIAAILLLILFLVSLRLKQIDTIFRLIIRYIAGRFRTFDRFSGQIERFVNAWQVYLKKPYLLLVSVFIGIIFQLLVILITILLANKVGIHIPFYEWCWIFGAVSIAMLLPITIGGIGLRECSIAFFLGWFGVSTEKALALSFAIFGVQIFGALFGLALDLKAKKHHKIS